MIINKKKMKKENDNCQIVDFATPVDHGVKIKENEYIGKYLDLVRELIKLWNRKVTVIQIKRNALITVPKGLVKGLEKLEIGGCDDNIRTIPLLR